MNDLFFTQGHSIAKNLLLKITSKRPSLHQLPGACFPKTAFCRSSPPRQPLKKGRVPRAGLREGHIGPDRVHTENQSAQSVDLLMKLFYD